ncbi:hydroxymethylbilane synthase [Streptococcus ovuberis]|uniref:Porphobilinogen deaminase n=1 Tax=Streptococcus ovuberis TaxID=1936207 RepID=A0A7X6MZR8_9STRE|nr:hydroxymethylbilane synthase [Streptococcus ovuberis]NKZ20413.1 hydroxymethylbilane synthase [Streptococcus ovuberis]
MKTIKVGTRQSQLAMTQTQQVVDRLLAHYPEVSIELVPYKTTGDRLVHVSLQEIGGKGVFVKDIEQALLDGVIDLAVHSLKDMPARLAPGCCLAAIPEREDVRDCLIFSQAGLSLETLPAGAVIGTSSLRRQAQLKALRPDLVFSPLRGNIDSRIKKVQEGQYDAIVLAMAGLNRMGWTSKDKGLYLEPLTTTACLPAISQGALGIECREDDLALRQLLGILHDEVTASCVGLEREVLGLMAADCTFPIGALATPLADGYDLQVMLADKEQRCCRVRVAGAGVDLAEQAVADLTRQGAVGIR